MVPQRNSSCNGNAKKWLIFYWVSWVDMTRVVIVTNLGISGGPRCSLPGFMGKACLNSGQRKSSGNMHKKDLCWLRELCLDIRETGGEAVTGIARRLGRLWVVSSLQRRWEQGRMTAKLLMLSAPSQVCSVCSYCFGIWCSPQWMLNRYNWAYDRKAAIFPLLFRYFLVLSVTLCPPLKQHTPPGSY